MKKIFNTMMAAAIAAFTFTACEDVPEPYNNPYDSKTEEPGVTVDPTGDGSEATPWNVVAALEACADLGAGEYVQNGDDVYVTGVITQIDELSTSYGNATYYISDNLKSGYQLEVYRGYSMDGEKFTSDSEIEVGDSVTVCGKIVFYNGSVLEFTTGSKLVYLKKGEGGGTTDKPEVSTVGSKDAPKTVTEALAAINAMSDGATSTEYWFVKGKVVRVTTSQANFETYKNLNYLISEDGTETNTITVYSGNGLDNAQFSGIDALQAGDEVVVYGQLQKFVNSNTGAMTPEIAKGNYLVKYTPVGGNSGDGETDEPATGDNLLVNGGFEAWTNGLPDNWKSTTTASNATLSQSTDAHTGSYAVKVAHDANGNKRISYKEITLKAGTYTASFYVKAADAAGASVNPGHVAVGEDGKVGTYNYDGYVNDITTAWQQVTFSFTLNTQSTINLLVMVPKNSGTDAIIDDFVLSTNNGGLVGDDDNTTEQPSGDGYKAVTTIASGNYVIGATVDGKVIVAQPLNSTYTYGYLYTTETTLINGTINTDATNEFKFTAVDGGYTIQDHDGRYLYMAGTYNSFNVDTTAPSEGHVWTVSFGSDNTVSIKNVLTGKTIQYSASYSSYGAYTDITNTLPVLYQK